MEPITVTTDINAPLNKVWECFSQPEHITQWSFASDDWHSPRAENDLRVGGKFTTSMAAKDGSFGFDFGGEYTEVEEHSLIAYKIGDGRKVTIHFTEKDGETNVTQTFDAESTHSIEQQRGGWQAIMDNFKKYTEARQF